MTVPAWKVAEWSGPAAAYLDALSLGSRTVTRIKPDQPTLVLGSTQPDHAAREGVAFVRRRSGGSAVLVDDVTLWVDLTIPKDDPLWDDDVGRAFHWLGRAWAEAIGGGAAWHDGAMVKTAWSPVVCFAGLGPGEVTVDGRKVVGMSQRRTRDGALFQCLVALEWDPAPLLGLLAMNEEDRQRGAVELADVAGGVGRGRGEELVLALLDVLGGI